MTLAIIGGGVAGLAAADALLAEGHDVRLFEAGRRAGGLVHTERTEGLLIDHGPDAIARTAPAAREAMGRLELEGEVVSPRGHAWLLRDDRLLPLPAGLLGMGPGAGWQMLRSPLFSLRGKLRFLAEPLAPKRTSDEDESVASFFQRRFGDEVAERLVDPLLGSIYRCSTQELSMDATLPHLATSERRGQSVTGGVLRALGRGRAGAKSPLVGFRDGMGALTRAYVERLGDRVCLDQPVRSLLVRRDGWELRFANGEACRAEGVVIATPAWNAAELLEGLDADLSAELDAIPVTGVHSVALAWPRKQVPHPLEGSGFLVPRAAARVLQACTWVSEKWPGRAPEGTVLVRAFLRSAADATDPELVALARDELAQVLGVRSEPSFAKVLRRHRALPRYRVGHRAYVQRLRERTRAFPRLALAGNAYDGIGMPACIASGRMAAAQVADSGGPSDFSATAIAAAPPKSSRPSTT